jgi:hypothetical protein
MRSSIYLIKARCLTKQLNERVYIMKSIKTFVAVIALATSFGSFAAQTVTATASTIDGAEAKIAAQAQEAGASSYKITQAFSVTAYT